MAGSGYRDYFKVLGVERSADADTVKRAFRKLARQYHPDVNPDDQDSEARFKEVSEAYEVLSDLRSAVATSNLANTGTRQECLVVAQVLQELMLTLAATAILMISSTIYWVASAAVRDPEAMQGAGLALEADSLVVASLAGALGQHSTLMLKPPSRLGSQRLFVGVSELCL